MVKIISDSTCDLSTKLLEKYNVTILPLHIVLGEDEYLDGINIHPDDIYRWSDENKTTPKTSAASLEDTMNVLEPFLKERNEIVLFCISEKMSTTGQVMRLAADELGAVNQVFVIDSRNLSTGIGLLVIEAAIMAQGGASGTEIVKRMESLIPGVRASFVVDTLTYLHRGGRCSSLTALAGGVLKIHPKIVVKDGSMDVEKKYRGRMSSVILSYITDMEDDLKKANKERVFITHSGCDKEIIDEVYQYLKQLKHFDEIIITRAGSVISSHCGPGTLGVLFIEMD